MAESSTRLSRIQELPEIEDVEIVVFKAGNDILGFTGKEFGEETHKRRNRLFASCDRHLPAKIEYPRHVDQCPICEILSRCTIKETEDESWMI